MFYVTLEGRINADTAEATMLGRHFPFDGILSQAAADRRGTALAVLDHKLYWVVAAQVQAPLPIGYVVAGVPIDDALVSDILRLSAQPKSVTLATVDPTGHLFIVAKSNGKAPELEPNASPPAPDQEARIVTNAGEEFLSLTTRLPTAAKSQPVLAVFDYPMAAALSQYKALIGPMLAVLAFSVVAAVGGAFFIAGGVSRPLEALAKTAERIGQGDYVPLEAQGDDEIGRLSRALGQMVEAIKVRQMELESAISSIEIARDEAVRANRAKSNFLANMSHELRTPLNAVIGFSEIIAKEVMGKIPNPSYVEYANDILASGRHLLEIVEEMLDLARIEAGTYVVSPELMRPYDVLREAVDMLRTKASTAKIAVSVDPAASEWPQLNADPVKLRQVFVNLLANGITYTPAGGRVHVSGGLDEGRFVIRFSDNGIGMNEEDIPLVVQPFYRVHSAHDAKYQGVGLGLPLCHAITRLHGGTLTIESALGQGTTVSVAIPVAGIDAAGEGRPESGRSRAIDNAA
jgi:signal transduction histidine kinase